jgi:hypothetical protein
MPAVPAQYIPPSDSRDSRAFDERVSEERKARKELIDTYWRYYEGDHHKPLAVAPGKRDDNVIINLCAQAIDKGVVFFAPDAPTLLFPGETPQPGDESPVQRALEAFWEHADLEAFVTDAALAGFISGHLFCKLLPPERAGDPPSVAVLDTRHVTAMWDVMNTKRALWYRLEWELDSETTRRQDIVPDWLLVEGEGAPAYDPDSTWTIIEYEKARTTQNKWAEQGRDAWAYPFSPIVQWKNGPAPHTFYGPSDLRHYRLNDAVNFVASNSLRIIKYHAHPRTIGVGVNADQVKETSIDGFFSIPADASVQNLEMRGDLASSMQMLDRLRSAFFTQMRTVDWSSQSDKVGQLTNFGLRVLFDDMMEQTEAKRRVYGQGIAEISRRAVIIMGHAAPEPPALEWPDPLPQARLELVQAAQMEQQLGFTSNRTLAADLGRDFDEEIERKSTEAQEGGDMLGSLLANIGRAGAF